ncbi:MAG: hypothetical protein ACFE8J_18030, partial [Candidatus Heimdallarchaeota archaeon]
QLFKKMTQKPTEMEKTVDFPDEHSDILNEIHKELNLRIKEKREIMYSDIINFIIRKGYKGAIFNKLLIWCNYNIRSGRFIVNI